MNVKATLSADDLARACADAMWKEDDASQALGMRIVDIRAGQATLTMTVRPDMVTSAPLKISKTREDSSKRTEPRL